MESEFTEPYVPTILPNDCEMTYVMEGDPPALVMEKDSETGEMKKKEDTAAWEACQEAWKTANLENIKSGKKLEGDDADAKATEIFDETVELEKEKAELAALLPPEEAGPQPALSETDKVIMAGFQDLLDTLDEVKVEWRTTFEDKKAVIMEFVQMLGLPNDEGGLEGFAKRGRMFNAKLGKRKLSEVTGKDNSAVNAKEVKAEVQKMIKENKEKNKKRANNSVVHTKEVKAEVKKLNKEKREKDLEKSDVH